MSPTIADAGGSGSATWTRTASCSWMRPGLRRTWCAAMGAVPAANAWWTPRHTAMCGRPLRCKKNLETGAARDRVLPCVRPLMRHGSWPRARMGVRGSGPHHWNALEALPMRLVLLTPPHRRCAIPVLRPPHAVDSLTPVHRLSGHGRSSIHPALGEQRPGHAGVLVRQSYDDQHGRLAGEHAGQQRAGRHTLALSPANHAAGRDDEKALESSLAPLLPASRPLDWREADPGGEVPTPS